MFGFKKKSKIDKILGEEKKNTKQDILTNQKFNVNKERIIEKLNELRRRLQMMDGFEEFSDKIEELMFTLKRMGDNPNKEAMKVVDWFIMLELVDCENYCNRQNYVGVSSCLYVIGNLINDRLSCGPYYTNEKYIKLKKEAIKLYVSLQNEQSKYEGLYNQTVKLIDKYNSSEENVSTMNIEKEVVRNKKILKQLKENIDKINKRLEVLNQALSDMELHNIYNDTEIDFVSEIEDVMDITADNNAEYASDSKLEKTFDKIHSKTLQDDLVVNDNLTSSAETVVKKKKKLDMSDLD